jgi:four helix bundle protein
LPVNIAEGQGRQSTGEFRQFLGNARGSLLEVETQLSLAERFQYLSPATGWYLTLAICGTGQNLKRIDSIVAAMASQGM